MTRLRKPFKYDVNVSKGGEAMHPVWICGTRRDAIATARFHGRRMWATGLWQTMHLEVRRRPEPLRGNWRTFPLVFTWLRPEKKND